MEMKKGEKDMTKIVKYKGASTKNFIGLVNALDHPNVVKKTISKINESITASVRLPLKAQIHIFSFRYYNEMSHSHDTVSEGEICQMALRKVNPERVQRIWGNLLKFLETHQGQYELLLMLSSDEKRCNLSLIDYYAPENWDY